MNDSKQRTKILISAIKELLLSLFFVLLFIALVAMATPVVQKSKRGSPLTTATNNAKQVYYLLMEFEEDFGEFPSDRTAREIQDFNRSLTGDYSNDYFRQLIAANYTNSEEIFFSRGSGKWEKPDNDISAKEALTEGECGFAYIKGQSTSDNSGRPLVMAPMYGDGFKFNPYTFDNKAVVLRIDGSVKQLRLNKDRHAMYTKGKTLFEGGIDSVWGEEGFQKSNLLYPKHPYTPKRRILKKPIKWINSFTVPLLLVSPYILFSIRRFVRRIKER